MKKVLFVATVTNHINAFHTPFLKMLKEQGYETHVASYGEEHIEYCDKHYNIPFQRFPIKIKNIKAYKQLKQIIDENKYDIIHCHTPVGGVLTRLAAKKARKNGTKVIYTAHGFHFYKGAPILNWIIYYPIEKYLSRYTDCLITINQEDYDLAKKKFKKAKQVELVHGVGVDESKFDFEMSDEEKHNLRKELGLKDNDFVLIQVGELNKNKNQIMSINAMKDIVKSHSNIHLLIVGQGVLEKYYKKEIEQYNLQKNIHMLGYRADIPRLLKISNVLLSLSYREGLPVNVIEGMMSGLPIIATDCRGNRDLSNIIIKNKNELKASILKLNNKKEDQNYNVHIYSRKSIDERMSQIYSCVLKKRILHLLSTNSYSGAENVAITIMNRLKPNSELKLVYSSPKGDIERILKQNDLEYKPLEKMTIKEIRRVCKKYQPDIIHAHDFRASVLAILATSKTTVIISHIHKNDPRMKSINIISLIYFLSSVRYKKILLVSKEIQNEFIFAKYLKNKIEVIGNPIDVDNILKKSNEIEILRYYDLLYLGRLSEEKNPLEFIRIIKILKEKKIDVKCAMIGNGNQIEQCKEYLEKYKLQDNIEMLGFLENPYPIIKNSKILCITSNWEGFGLVAIEAMLLGVPVVARNVGGLKKIVDNKVGSLVETTDDYVKSIIELLKNDSLRKEKEKNAINKAKSVQNIELYINNLKEIYEGEKI